MEPNEEVVHILRHGIGLEFATEKMKRETATVTTAQTELNQMKVAQVRDSP